MIINDDFSFLVQTAQRYFILFFAQAKEIVDFFSRCFVVHSHKAVVSVQHFQNAITIFISTEIAKGLQ